ncbi:MAG: DUF2497 domain-containing protein [Pseudomonadota bacterium]
MEEILASIRRIISDEDGGSQPSENEAADPEPEDPAGTEMSQNDLDALFDEPEDDGSMATDEPDIMVVDEEPAADPGEAVIVEGMLPDETEISFAEDEPADDEDAPLELGPELEVHEPEPEPTPMQDPAPSPVNDLAEALLSPATDAVVSSAFGDLAHTILAKNARTLEDLVQEMLRPMLKIWLDDNLPVIVERLVRQEIERVSRGGGQQ